MSHMPVPSNFIMYVTNIKVLLVLGLISSLDTQEYYCYPGRYLFSYPPDPEVCLQCTDGETFMPYSRHRITQCFNCKQIHVPDQKIIVSRCNVTHDAVIGCRPGYYRRLARNDQEQDWCEKCSECEFPARPCEGYNDTVCCETSNYEAVMNKDGVYICQEKPLVCGPGQFVDTITVQCLPCPPSTFMTDDRHNNTACHKCQTTFDLGSHQVILHSCNSTHPAVIGCEDGYFTDSPPDLLLNKVTCSPCSTCQHEGRKCDRYHDTVCCQQADMIVADTATGPECRSNNQTSESRSTDDVTACGKDQYLYNNINNNSVTCLPCVEGTYMDEINHTSTSCKNCTEIMGQYLLPSTCLSLTKMYQQMETVTQEIYSLKTLLVDSKAGIEQIHLIITKQVTTTTEIIRTTIVTSIITTVVTIIIAMLSYTKRTGLKKVWDFILRAGCYLLSHEETAVELPSADYLDDSHQQHEQEMIILNRDRTHPESEVGGNEENNDYTETNL